MNEQILFKFIKKIKLISLEINRMIHCFVHNYSWMENYRTKENSVFYWINQNNNNNNNNDNKRKIIHFEKNDDQFVCQKIQCELNSNEYAACSIVFREWNFTLFQ